MLRDDVVAAVAAQRFSVHAVRHVDEAIELLSGVPAGDAVAPVPDSVSARIVARLADDARLRGGSRRRAAARTGTTAHPHGVGDGHAASR